jgi:DNA-binding GntR family transcriptional regulator
LPHEAEWAEVKDQLMANTDSAFRVDRVAAPLRKSVTENIRNAIAAGRFQAGDRLPERELCELVGVSRTLVREAIRQLESEGLITVEPHRGPSVSRFSRAQAQCVYEVRIELEGLACRLFAENATEEQQRALKDAFNEIKSAAKRGDRQDRVRTKNEFYSRLIDGAQNEALGSCLHILNSRITLLRSTSMQVPGRMEKSIAELSKLMDALMARDGKRASERAQHHVRMAAKAAMKFLPSDESQ